MFTSTDPGYVLSFAVPDMESYTAIRDKLRDLNHKHGHRVYRHQYGFRIPEESGFLILERFPEARFYVIVVRQQDFEALPVEVVDEMGEFLCEHRAHFFPLPTGLAIEVSAMVYADEGCEHSSDFWVEHSSD